jgi:hypothetical protein
MAAACIASGQCFSRLGSCSRTALTLGIAREAPAEPAASQHAARQVHAAAAAEPVRQCLAGMPHLAEPLAEPARQGRLGMCHTLACAPAKAAGLRQTAAARSGRTG